MHPNIESPEGSRQSLPQCFPAEITYRASDCAVSVRVIDEIQAAAVVEFARKNHFEHPAPGTVRPVYHCAAKTHANGEVLWA